MALYAKIDCNLDSNPKIRKAGREGREVFLFLLRRNRLIDANGFLPLLSIDSDYLADQLMMSRNDAVTGVTACVTAKLIDVTTTTVIISGWEDEWSREPSSNAERQAAFRIKQKEKAQLDTYQQDIVTDSNDTNVTRNRSNVREEKRREEKRREEESVETPSPAHAGPVSLSDLPKARRAERAGLSREVACVLRVLSRYSGVAYTGSKAHLRLIKARLREGYTVDDLRKIVPYCGDVKGWCSDEKMAPYMRPETLYGAANIEKYAPHARAWYAKEYGDEPLKSVDEILAENLAEVEP